MLARSLTLAIAATCLSGVSAQAAIVEYFNGYGTTTTTVTGLNGGEGWTGAWAGDLNPDYVPLAENAAFNLTYTAAGYSNAGNGSAPSDGLAMMGGGSAGSVTSRTLRSGGTTVDTGLTGTIWISALANSGSSSSSHMLVWMDRPDVTNSYVAIRGLAARLRYAGTDLTGAASEYAINTTYLFLAKVVINASGTNDTLDFWINPNLTGGEAGLGTPKLSGANNTNAYGNAFSGIGLSFEGYGKIDSIRISNSASAFSDVTLVPEPAFAGIVGLAAVAGLARRRRS